jgi:hypothetical protein
MTPTRGAIPAAVRRLIFRFKESRTSMNSVRRLSICFGICLLAECSINLLQTDSEPDQPGASERQDIEGPSTFEIRRGNDLDRQLARMLTMNRERESIAGEFIVGSVTLAAAGARFCELASLLASTTSYFGYSTQASRSGIAVVCRLFKQRST